MKYNLETISDSVKNVTGITLEQMTFKVSDPEILEARYLFILIALDYGIYKNKYEITDFIEKRSNLISYAKKKRYLITSLRRATENKLFEKQTQSVLS